MRIKKISIVPVLVFFSQICIASDFSTSLIRRTFDEEGSLGTSGQIVYVIDNAAKRAVQTGDMSAGADSAVDSWQLELAWRGNSRFKMRVTDTYGGTYGIICDGEIVDLGEGPLWEIYYLTNHSTNPDWRPIEERIREPMFLFNKCLFPLTGYVSDVKWRSYKRRYTVEDITSESHAEIDSQIRTISITNKEVAREVMEVILTYKDATRPRLVGYSFAHKLFDRFDLQYNDFVATPDGMAIASRIVVHRQGTIRRVTLLAASINEQLLLGNRDRFTLDTTSFAIDRIGRDIIEYHEEVSVGGETATFWEE